MFSRKPETETRAAFTSEEANALNAATEAATKARTNWTAASDKVAFAKQRLREAAGRPAWEVAPLYKAVETAQEELDEATPAVGPADAERKRVERETRKAARERFAPIQAQLVEAIKETPVVGLREAHTRLVEFTTAANSLLGMEHALPILGFSALGKVEAWLEFVDETLRPKEARRTEGLEAVRIRTLSGLKGLPPGFHPSNQRGDVVSVPAGVARNLVKSGVVERV